MQYSTHSVLVFAKYSNPLIPGLFTTQRNILNCNKAFVDLNFDHSSISKAETVHKVLVCLELVSNKPRVPKPDTSPANQQSLRGPNHDHHIHNHALANHYCGHCLCGHGPGSAHQSHRSDPISNTGQARCRRYTCGHHAEIGLLQWQRRRMYHGGGCCGVLGRFIRRVRHYHEC